MDEILETAKYIGIVLAELFLGIYFCKQYNEVILKDKQEISIEKVNIVVDKIGVYEINDKYELEVKAFSKEDYKKNQNMLTNLNVIWYNSSKLPINLRNRCDGDKIKVSNGTKKIKDILIDHKIPKEQRDTLLLLAKGNEVINIFGVRKSYDLLKSINNDILILLKEKE